MIFGKFRCGKTWNIVKLTIEVFNEFHCRKAKIPIVIGENHKNFRKSSKNYKHFKQYEDLGNFHPMN
jgi:hypothetical protein